MEALARIAEAHVKWVQHDGSTSGDCAECIRLWPCPTYVWATDDRDSMACWDPIDDEDDEDDEDAPLCDCPPDDRRLHSTHGDRE
jgi:hypothetical protein